MRCTFAILAALTTLASSPRARADGASHVGMIDTARVFAPNGVTVWVAARARLDVERKTFVAVEAPDGKTSEPISARDIGLGPAETERLQKRLDKLAQESNQRRAWSLHEQEVLDAVRTSVFRGLAQYAKAHGIDLVLDRSQIAAAVLVLMPGVDITDAFIKTYNAGERTRTRDR